MPRMALDPVDAQADCGASDHGEIQYGGGVTNSTSVFSGSDIKSEVESIFYAPMKTVGNHHLRGGHLRERTRTEQPIRFDFQFFAGFTVNKPR